MREQASLAFRDRNPDVLSTIANLSNDEVFTPPEFANVMLDQLAISWAAANNGANIWSNPNVTFLDPFTKSGVFLREITRRLSEGLVDAIPDLQKRIDHITSKQVFGIAITRLTALLSRRSVYCSKFANGEHSISKAFDTEDGNIWFQPLDHTWVSGRCVFCGAGRGDFQRDSALESHAYALIHSLHPKFLIAEIFGETMQFDVVIGNPPYQLDDGGFGASAAPIYNKFVEKAKELEPRFLSMVIPARWFAGGKGLDDFRELMLSDKRIRSLDDYPDASEVFPGVSIKGGVCYFLWDRDNEGDCVVSSHNRTLSPEPSTRPLLENGAKVFIRFNEALPILKKVIAFHSRGGVASLQLPANEAFHEIVSARKHFGIPTNFRGKTSGGSSDVLIYQNGGPGYISRSSVTKNAQDIDKWKVFVPIAGSGSNVFPDTVIGKPFIGAPGTLATETYNLVGPFASESEAANALSYMSTKLMRFLVLLHKPTQHTAKGVYSFVPLQDFSQKITDEMLFAKYELTSHEIEFVYSLIKPLELVNE